MEPYDSFQAKEYSAPIECTKKELMMPLGYDASP